MYGSAFIPDRSSSKKDMMKTEALACKTTSNIRGGGSGGDHTQGRSAVVPAPAMHVDMDQACAFFFGDVRGGTAAVEP